eukprot:GGOE01019516.1.p1 GENE.GGOE01019516.1~~GGOE01019516.1.p1  ORF type:complete len:801 (-),score=130.60 GGOE01019516.1:53-2371(-)
MGDTQLSSSSASFSQVASIKALKSPNEVAEHFSAFCKDQTVILQRDLPPSKGSLWPPLMNGPPPALEHLQPTLLRDLVANADTIQHGCVLFAQVVKFPAFQMTGVHLLLQDLQGDCIHVTLYHCLPKGVSVGGYLPIGSKLALLEPYIRAAPPNYGGWMIRCDNPQCVVRFRSSVEWHRAVLGNTANPDVGDIDGISPEQLRERGNSLFKKGQFFTAAEFYSDALRLLSASDAAEFSKICGNRAECFLRLGRWSAAKNDAAAVLERDPQNVKAKCRLVRALLGQERPAEALPIVEDLLGRMPGDAVVQGLQSDVVNALREQEEGVFDLQRIGQEATSQAFLGPAHASYVSSDIEVVAIPGKGRGVRATKALHENQLILARRAFAFLPGEAQRKKRQAATGGSSEADTSFQFTAEVIQKLLANPEEAPAFYTLCAGPQYDGVPPPDGTVRLIDPGRIRSILLRNWFDACCDEWMEIVDGWRQRSVGEKAQSQWLQKVQEAQWNTGSGIWLRESYFNNSCAPNCLYFQIADFQFTYVTQPVEPGEELCIPYCPCESSPSEREGFFHSFGEGDGFTCCCSRCVYLAEHASVCSLEEECFDSHRQACELVAERGIPLALAAESIPRTRRRQVQAALRVVPMEHRSALGYVLVLEGAALQWEGEHPAALALYQEAAAIRYAVRGGSFHFQRFIDLCLVAGAALACGNIDLAVETLRHAYCTCCAPFGRSVDSFQFLAMTYCTPRWKDVAQFSSAQEAEFRARQVEVVQKAVSLFASK